jgi:hypothetical protein
MKAAAPSATNGSAPADQEALVKLITDRVLAALQSK